MNNQETIEGNKGYNPIEDEDDDLEFAPCRLCDGHDACEDFGCAYELGLGRMVRKEIPLGSDGWT